MPLADVSLNGYPAVLLNLGAVVVLAALIAAVLRLLDTRLPFGSPVVPEAEALEVPHPRAGAETVVERGSGAGS
ncbi:hypothetical protein ACTI_75000 [Actinoplanes sp. OR16]|uniref:hypothetical protein n=1 Tax=Actinoplanes sp. OR16 TaxID=946334 RepID=UPI000F6ED58E|nr:hypothetical protein [Actinoplanes sp. OR16]BBH70815.1 hypothetical protein ACTI_75000 [Actinoplanes sp. OR16]